MGKSTVYEIVTEKIIEKLEQGTVPWKMPWKMYDDGTGARNLVYKKPYRGINAFLTAMMPFESPFYLTDRQVAKEDKWSVKEDQKGQYLPIVYWNWRTREQLDEAAAKGQKIAPFFVRYSRVYNVEQLEGVEVPDIKPIELTEHERIDACEDVLKNMPNKPEIEAKGNRACYSPSQDLVRMPKLGQFNSPEEYYCTLFHELIHSTGHKDRVHRKELMSWSGFGSKDYSKEELVAEMGAAFLCAKTNIEQATLDNSAAYIKGWLKKLKSNPKFVIEAAQAAQKGADYVLGQYKDFKKDDAEMKKAA